MSKKFFLPIVLALFAMGSGLNGFGQSTQPTRATADVVAAAQKFLATLDETQRGKGVFDFKDDAQRQRWSNFPSGAFQRAGLRMGDLTQPQRDAAMAVVAAALSPQGYEKVLQMVQADEELRITGGGRGGPGGGGPGGGGRRGPGGQGGPGGPNDAQRGGPRGQDGGPGGRRGRGGPGGGGGGGGANFGRDNYYISFLGQPSTTEPWLLQFGGHHLGLNITIVGEKGVLTPSLTGAQPASYIVDGKAIRPLGKENDKGFELLGMLDEAQRKQAILAYRVNDLVLGPGQDGRTIQPEGLKASGMNQKQRELLLDLIAEWSGIVNEGYNATRMNEIKAALDDTYFAWSGPTTVEPGKNGTSYYRIQGPKLVIEYAPQNSDDHIHTIYRDPTNDYGQLLKP